jgi:hypothetical protein
MTIKPKDLFEAAQALNRLLPPLVSDEVCARTMANRMYYAAYHAVREAIRSHLGNPRFDVTHSALVGALTQAPDEDVRRLGRRLDRLRANRVASDYRLDETLTKFVIAVHLSDARYVLDNVGRLARRFPRIQARQANPRWTGSPPSST